MGRQTLSEFTILGLYFRTDCVGPSEDSIRPSGMSPWGTARPADLGVKYWQFWTQGIRERLSIFLHYVPALFPYNPSLPPSLFSLLLTLLPLPGHLRLPSFSFHSCPSLHFLFSLFPFLFHLYFTASPTSYLISFASPYSSSSVPIPLSILLLFLSTFILSFFWVSLRRKFCVARLRCLAASSEFRATCEGTWLLYFLRPDWHLPTHRMRCSWLVSFCNRRDSFYYTGKHRNDKTHEFARNKQRNPNLTRVMH
jgi:hypothetical protein